MKDQTYFLKDWLKEPDFKNWLADTNDNNIYHKTFKLSRQALTSYASVKSHKKHFHGKQFFFIPKNSEHSKACSSNSQNNTLIGMEIQLSIKLLSSLC